MDASENAKRLLKSDRRAAVLCVADDICLNEILDKHLGIKTHRNHTPQFKFTKPEEAIFQKQKEIYNNFISKPVPFTIAAHDRFDEVNGAKVVATKTIPSKKVLFELCGQLYPFTDNFCIPGVNDFSTVISSVNDKNYMFLGIVSFINHDCKPNVQWFSRTKSLSCVITIHTIYANSEITIFYGQHFFGYNNSECKCKTCELNKRGFFTEKSAVSMDSFKHSLQKTQTTTGQELSNTVGDDRSVNTDDASTNLTINKEPTTNSVNDDDEINVGDDDESNDDESNDDKSNCASDDYSNDSTYSNTDRIPDNLYECRECQKLFKYKSWYMNHMSTHSINGIHSCRYCPRLFKRKDNLQRHFITHFGGKSYDCTVCGQPFAFKFNLKTHISMKHKKVTLHKCTVCNMLFKDTRNLRYHDNIKHSKIYPFKCPVCNQAFGAPNQLCRHRRQNNH